MSGTLEALEHVGSLGAHAASGAEHAGTTEGRAAAWQAAESEAAGTPKPGTGKPGTEPGPSMLEKAGHLLTNPHVILGAASFAPSVFGSAASAADGLLYAAQGDKADAAISLGAAAVGLVSDAGAAKLAGTGLKAGAEMLADGGKLAHAGQGAKAADELAHGAAAAHAETAVAKAADAKAAVTKAADPVSEALGKGETLSAGKPPVELDHVFEGEVSAKKGKAAAKGFHHGPGDSLHPNARVVSETTPRNAHGVYEAKVEVTNPKTGTAYTKRSTMFPDTMSRSDVVGAIQHAYDHATVKAGNSFTGPSGHGFDITGYTSGTGPALHIRTGFPVYTK